MRDVLHDEKLRKLLKTKQHLEMVSWIIPTVAIAALFAVLYLFVVIKLSAVTLVALLILIVIIIAGYIFDNRITNSIHASYRKLAEYFQGKIIPKLLLEENPGTVYEENVRFRADVVDKVELFNNLKEYKAYFHCEGEIEDHKYSFDEVVFTDLVEYDTTGQKEYNGKIKSNFTYHWYTVELNREYPVEALYKNGNFDNYDGRLIKNLHKFDFNESRIFLSSDNDLALYIEDLNESKHFTTDKIIKGINIDPIVYNMIMAVYVEKAKIHIIIEKFNDFLNLSHSNHIVIENLLNEFYEEQKVVKSLIKTFDK